MNSCCRLSLAALICTWVAICCIALFAASADGAAAHEGEAVNTLSGHSGALLDSTEEPTFEERRKQLAILQQRHDEWRERRLQQKASPWLQSVWAERARKDARRSSSFTYRARPLSEQNWHPAIAARREADKQQAGAPDPMLNTRTTSFPRVRDSSHPVWKGKIVYFVCVWACFCCCSAFIP